MVAQHRVNGSEETVVVATSTQHELLVKHLEKRRLLNVLNQVDGLVVVLEFDV